MNILIITGMSGAGKSLAVKYLEDLGYFCVDNIPPELIPKMLEICYKTNNIDRIALVVDIRGGDLFKTLYPTLDSMKEQGYKYEILFLDASDSELVKRYMESRRSHPLAPDGRLMNGISAEREMLSGLRDIADYIIDISSLSSRIFKEELYKIFSEGRKFKGIVLEFISFGFKYGIPLECDLVFNVRFIPNPYYFDDMRILTGKDEKVREYVMERRVTKDFLEKLTDMLNFLIPNYIEEGKAQLVVGIGCTGGRHRSVALSEYLHGMYGDIGYRTVIEHRDIDKDMLNSI